MNKNHEYFSSSSSVMSMICFLLLAITIYTSGTLSQNNFEILNENINMTDKKITDISNNLDSICPDLTCPAQKECETLPLFIQEAKTVADAHYYSTASKDYYVCEQFAKELFARLKADGYDVYYCTGTALWCIDEGNRESECGHAWVKIGKTIAIESTNGEIIDPKDYSLRYKEKRCVDNI